MRACAPTPLPSGNCLLVGEPCDSTDTWNSWTLRIKLARTAKTRSVHWSDTPQRMAANITATRTAHHRDDHQQRRWYSLSRGDEEDVHPAETASSGNNCRILPTE